MPTLYEAVAARTPLVIDHPDGGRRILAACLPHSEGMVFADTYWFTNDSSHPFHVVPGKVTGNAPPYHVERPDADEPAFRSILIEQILPGDPLWREWLDWTERYLADYPGATQAAAEAAMRRTFGD